MDSKTWGNSAWIVLAPSASDRDWTVEPVLRDYLRPEWANWIRREVQSGVYGAQALISAGRSFEAFAAEQFTTWNARFTQADRSPLLVVPPRRTAARFTPAEHAPLLVVTVVPKTPATLQKLCLRALAPAVVFGDVVPSRHLPWNLSPLLERMATCFAHACIQACDELLWPWGHKPGWARWLYRLHNVVNNRGRKGAFGAPGSTGPFGDLVTEEELPRTTDTAPKRNARSSFPIRTADRTPLLRRRSCTQRRTAPRARERK